MEIKDYQSYNTLMRNGFYDKLFFVDKLFEEWHSILDYGCATGFTCNSLAEIFPDKIIYGYDNNPEMILEAKENMKFDHQMFVSDLNEIKGKIDVLYLSSVIHEVYSYLPQEEIDKFWEYVFKSGFKYIIVRDMMYEDIYKSGRIGMKMIKEYFEKASLVKRKIEENNESKYLEEFEKNFGSIFDIKNLIHFLLKYQYFKSQNWEREVNENYLPLEIKEFKEKCVENKYEILYEDCRTLPYLKHCWKRDFDLTIEEKIHCKFILKLEK